MPGTRFTDIRRFGTIDSTNRYLLDQARHGAPGGVVVVADHQTAGRGRLGRRWEEPAGTNLLASVLVRPAPPDPQRHLATVVVALAAVDAIAAVVGIRASIKWPNDLLGPSGGKLAGVLAESDAGSDVVVVGIGINVNWPGPGDTVPPEVAERATSLRAEIGHPVDRDRLLTSLLGALEPRVDALATPSGRDAQVKALRDGCSTIGTAVRVSESQASFEGTAVDVTGDGHLVVSTATGRRTVLVGDVVHLRGAGESALVPGQAGRPPGLSGTHWRAE